MLLVSKVQIGFCTILALLGAGWVYNLDFSTEAKSRKAAHESIVREGHMGGWTEETVTRIVTLNPHQVGKSLWAMRVEDPNDKSTTEYIAFVETVPCKRDALLPFEGNTVELQVRRFRADQNWKAPRGYELKQPLYLMTAGCTPQ